MQIIFVAMSGWRFVHRNAQSFADYSMVPLPMMFLKAVRYGWYRRLVNASEFNRGYSFTKPRNG